MVQAEMRILLVTLVSPFEKSFGAQQRSWLIWNALSQVGEVEVLVLSPGDHVRVEQSADKRIVAEGTWKASAIDLNPYTVDLQLNAAVGRHLDLRSYDIIVGRYLAPISRLTLPPEARTILDLDDLIYRMGVSAPIAGRPLRSAKIWLRNALKRGACSRYKRFWFVSERDRQELLGWPGETLPNVPLVALRSVTPQLSTTNILFVGSLWYGPNLEGVKWFVRHCWFPLVDRVPTARLRLVGGGDKNQRDDWTRVPGVEAPGYVDDLAVEYAQALVTIAPIFEGGGSNIKVLESLAYGRVCVTSALCADAFCPDLETGTYLRVANSAEEFVETLDRLMADVPGTTRQGEIGHAVATQRFNQERFTDTVVRTIHACLQ